jgi:hypothetical protein
VLLLHVFLSNHVCLRFSSPITCGHFGITIVYSRIYVECNIIEEVWI